MLIVVLIRMFIFTENIQKKEVVSQTWYSFLSKEIFTGLSALVICSFSRNSVVFWTVTGALSISWRVRNIVLYCSWKKIILVIDLKKDKNRNSISDHHWLSLIFVSSTCGLHITIAYIQSLDSRKSGPYSFFFLSFSSRNLQCWFCA